MKLHENEITAQIAMLCAVDTGEYDVAVSLDELEELARTAGAQVIGRAVQKREEFDAALLIGRGKLEEIAEFCRNNEVALLIFDHELTASQIRSIEKEAGVRAVDRTM
jgi:GTP-binding protein HflX